MAKVMICMKKTQPRIDFSSPKVMGIVNITPDSFYDGLKAASVDDFLKKADQCVEEGADILDLGACSTRPGAELVSVSEEWARLKPLLTVLRKKYPNMILSIDTSSAEIADRACSEGADWINDVSGGNADENMFSIIAKWKVPYVLMHSKGNPQTMQNQTNYADLFEEMSYYFSQKVDALRAQGCADIIVDPGFGFAKTINQNYELIPYISFWKKLFKTPILIGVSRKSMIYNVLGVSPEEALNGTSFVHALTLLQGADILRVHDVKQAKELVRLMEKV